MKWPLAPIVITALSEFSPPLIPLLEILKEHLLQSVKAALVPHAPPSVAIPVEDSSRLAAKTRAAIIASATRIG